MYFNEINNINVPTEYYNLNLSGGDNRIFIDPYEIYRNNDEFSINCSNSIINYFDKILKAVREGNEKEQVNLVQYLCENNETRIGYSSSEEPRGKSLGINKGIELLDVIKKSKAVESGLVSDIFDTSLLIDNVDKDKISDMITSIIYLKLVNFTQDMCKKYNIEMSESIINKKVWDEEKGKWIQLGKIFLPHYNNKPIILVPNSYLKTIYNISYQNFYNTVMIPFYEKEIEKNPQRGLVKILKNGYRKPLRGKIREKYPCSKENVIAFIKDYPTMYIEYKKNKGI